MPRIECSRVEVYLFRRRARRVEFLALRRAASRRSLPGVWQPVTGHIEWREKMVECAAREVAEETGLTPRRWWALEAPTVYLNTVSDAIVFLPLFAAEVGPRDRVTLSKEHDAYRFLPLRQAAKRFLWEGQRRGLDSIRREVLGGGALSRAREVTDLIVGARPAGRNRRAG
jgi:dihydroneopterin triphosphate diphosphatase